VWIPAALAGAGALLGWLARGLIADYTRPAGGVPLPRPGVLFPPVPLSGMPPGPREMRAWPAPGTTEAAMATAFTVAALWAHTGPALGAACWLAGVTVPLAFIDAATGRLPAALTTAASCGTAACLILVTAAGGRWQDLARAAAGAAVLAAFYAFLAVAGAAGAGDMRLAPALGGILAWAGWQPLVSGAVAAYLLAAPVSALLWSRRHTGTSVRTRIPFAPFMIAGTFLALALPAAPTPGPR
jgi:leader peptidase (prepilin peptidase)/N-methyltransferase